MFKIKKPKLKSIVKLKKSVYKLNNCVIISIQENGEIKADFDPDMISEKDANRLIDEFFDVE